MKNKQSFVLLLSATLFLSVISCKKNNDVVNPVSQGVVPSLVRIQQGTDADITNDTVLLISYIDTAHISSIVDSLYQDTLKITTTVSGKPLTVNETYGYSASYSYNDNDVLQQIDCIVAGSHEQDKFEYTGGVVSKRTHYSNLGSGPLSKTGSFVYTFTAGNITSIKEYDLNGNLVQEITATYGTQTNRLQNFGLINVSNMIGTETFLNLETYFNKNMLTGYTTTGGAGSVSNQYTFSSNGQPLHVVSTDTFNYHLLTWNFSYK